MDTVKAIDAVPGDLIDLQGDPYADPTNDPNDLYAFELARVSEVEREGGDTVVIHFDSASVGFPSDHGLWIDREAMEYYARTAPLPRATVYETYTNRHMGTFYGEGAREDAETLCGEIMAREPSAELDVSVSDERCENCRAMFWHEAPIDGRCPQCEAPLTSARVS